MSKRAMQALSTREEPLPPLSEKDFLKQVCQLAELRHWHYLHLRPAMTRDSWRTPIQGSLGKGWPDLTLVRKDRLLFVELKADGGKLTPDQERVLDILGGVGEVDVWKPADWPAIEAVLR